MIVTSYRNISASARPKYEKSQNPVMIPELWSELQPTNPRAEDED
jgi:hypothetical protein